MPSKNQNVEYRTENNSSFINSIYNSNGEAKELADCSYNMFINNSFVINKCCSEKHLYNEVDTAVIYNCYIIIEPINSNDDINVRSSYVLSSDDTNSNIHICHHRKKTGKTGVKFIENPVFNNCNYIDNGNNPKPIICDRYYDINNCIIIDDSNRCHYDEYGRININYCNITLMPILDDKAIRVMKSSIEIANMIEKPEGDDGDCGGIGIKHYYFGE